MDVETAILIANAVAIMVYLMALLTASIVHSPILLLPQMLIKHQLQSPLLPTLL
jgi:hypothetical protein